MVIPPLTPTARIYQRDDLEALNLLQTPVWIFDIDRKSMYWANTIALEMWNADSLEELLSRDFASDMSETIERRLEDLQARLAKGEIVHETWTLYPKGKTITVAVSQVGIRIGDGRVAVLSEGELPDKHQIDHSIVRDVEMLRHLPIAVSRFNIDGTLSYENPEAMTVFGTHLDKPPQQSKEGEETDLQEEQDDNDFLSRFCDRQVGLRALDIVVQGKDHNIEAEQYTTEGCRWFSISIRRRQDPVTSQNMILYSARDITEVVQARDLAKQATLKSEFMSVMAHEIRTPLHQIIGYMDLLELSRPLHEQQLEHIQLVQSSTASLMAIINDLLDYTKLESGKIKIENISFELYTVITACMSSFEAQAQDKGVELVRKLGNDLPEALIGDPNRLRQILLNLLSNALKFTKIGSVTLDVVRISGVDPDACRLRFAVTDTGIGIEPEHQRHLFQKYHQANASVSRNYGGTGLGLAICKSLTEAMEGGIGLESTVGVGTRVWFELPFRLSDLTKKRQVTDLITQNPRVDDAELSMRVLVAEDNTVNQKVVKAMLLRIGHTVTLVADGQAAVDEVMNTEYDIVLMDIQMPVMDGVEATKRIREAGSKVPIIGLTAGYMPSELQQYRSAGMNDCIGKPVRLTLLKQVLADRRDGSSREVGE